MNKIDTITLVGCGAMGTALLKGWLNADVAKEYWVVSPHKASVQPFIEKSNRVRWFAGPEELPEAVTTLVIALKPFVLSDVLPMYKSVITPDSLVVSVATSKSLGFYRGILNHEAIRAMPNTPVSVNRGVIGLFAESSARECWESHVEALLGPLGLATWVSSEDVLNQVTALSGSGPAYVFYMIEAMAAAGAKHGLSKEQAYEMALYTVAGAGAYALDSGVAAAKLRESVTSLKGTTEQALKVLMSNDGMGPLMEMAIAAAYERAKELAR